MFWRGVATFAVVLLWRGVEDFGVVLEALALRWKLCRGVKIFMRGVKKLCRGLKNRYN